MACRCKQACCPSRYSLKPLLYVCRFGNLHYIVCQYCNGDEEICLLALRTQRGVNKRQQNTKEEKHSCNIWVKDGLAWAGLQTESPPCFFKGEAGGGGSAEESPQSNTSWFMLQCLFPQCGLLGLVCQAEGVFSSSLPAPC